MLITLDPGCQYSRAAGFISLKGGNLYKLLDGFESQAAPSSNLLERELLMSYKETQNSNLMRQFNFAKGSTVTQTGEPSIAGKESSLNFYVKTKW